MTYRRRYRRSAATTTAVTVVPSSRAFVTAAVQTSSGMRSDRGIVATSLILDIDGDKLRDDHAVALAAVNGEPCNAAGNTALEELDVAPPSDVLIVDCHVDGHAGHDSDRLEVLRATTDDVDVDTSTPNLGATA